MLPRKINFGNPGGFPLSQDTLAYMQCGYEMICDALVGSIGKGVTAILAGVEWNGSVWTEGLVVHNNKLVYFGESGSTPDDVLVVETYAHGETYNDGNYHDCYTETTAYAGWETDFYLKNLPRVNWQALNASVNELAQSFADFAQNFASEHLNGNSDDAVILYDLTVQKLPAGFLIDGKIQLNLDHLPGGTGTAGGYDYSISLPQNSILHGIIASRTDIPAYYVKGTDPVIDMPGRKARCLWKAAA